MSCCSKGLANLHSSQALLSVCCIIILMKAKSENTTALDKLLVSVINTALVFVISSPFLLLPQWRYIFVGLFLVYQVMTALSKSGRGIGQRLLHVYWAKDYSLKNRLIFAVLYSASFSTILVWVFFPFDLLLFNLICVQLPMVYFTGYTLHGYLSGKMYGVRKER